MVELEHRNLGPEIEDMFIHAEPAEMRLLGVLNGDLSGRIIADRAGNPNWVVVQERIYGSLYLGGDIDPMTLSCLFDRFLEDGDVLIGMWHHDPRWSWVIKEPECDGQVLDFYNRPIGRGLEPYLDLVPERCGIIEVGQTLLQRSVNFEKHVANFCNLEDAISNLMGFYLMYGDEILCETLAGPVIRGTREPGVDTREHYRRKGYATVTCAYLIDACEKAGHQRWWNCNKANIASTALA